MPQSQIVPLLPPPLSTPEKFVKTVQLHPIQYSSLAEYVCNFGCVDGFTAPWCMRQSKTWSISTIYATVNQVSLSYFLIASWFVSRRSLAETRTEILIPTLKVKTLLEKSRRKCGDNMEWITPGMYSYTNFGNLAVEGNFNP